MTVTIILLILAFILFGSLMFIFGIWWTARERYSMREIRRAFWRAFCNDTTKAELESSWDTFTEHLNEENHP